MISMEKIAQKYKHEKFKEKFKEKMNVEKDLNKLTKSSRRRRKQEINKKISMHLIAINKERKTINNINHDPFLRIKRKKGKKRKNGRINIRSVIRNIEVQRSKNKKHLISIRSLKC